jgi:chromosome segregation ATPase
MEPCADAVGGCDANRSAGVGDALRAERADVAATQVELETLRREVEVLTHNLGRLLGAQGARVKREEDLRAELLRAHARLARRDEEYAQLSAHVSAHAGVQIAALHAALDKLSSQKGEVEYERDCLRIDCTRLLREHDELVHERNALLADRDRVVREHDRLLQERNNLAQERDGAIAQCQATALQLADVRGHRDHLLARISRVRRYVPGFLLRMGRGVKRLFRRGLGIAR